MNKFLKFKMAGIAVRAVVFGIITLGVSSCGGYQAMYGQENSVKKALTTVALGEIRIQENGYQAGARRVAQAMRWQLANDFYNKNATAYRLDVEIEESKTTLAVRRDAVEQRLQVDLVANVVLWSEKNKKAFTVRLESSAPYNVEDSPYGTEAGRDHARNSAVKVLSQEIVYRVSLFLKGNG